MPGTTCDKASGLAEVAEEKFSQFVFAQPSDSELTPYIHRDRNSGRNFGWRSDAGAFQLLSVLRLLLAAEIAHRNGSEVCDVFDLPMPAPTRGEAAAWRRAQPQGLGLFIYGVTRMGKIHGQNLVVELRHKNRVEA